MFQLVPDAVPDPPRPVETTTTTNTESTPGLILRFKRLLVRPFLAPNNISYEHAARSRQRNHNREEYRDHYNENSNYTGPYIYNKIQYTIGTTLTQNLVVNHGKPEKGEKNQKRSRKNKKQQRKIDLYIRNLIGIQSSLTNIDKSIIKMNNYGDWKKIYTKLGLDEGEATQVFVDHVHLGIGEVILKLVLLWEQHEGRDATVGKLFEVLWFSKEYDCIEKLAKNYGH